jgi:uncharacterized protein YcnI
MRPTPDPAARARRAPVPALAALAIALLALALPATAAAHVSVVPKTASAGSYSVLDVRVPNERDDAATVKVDLQLPPGFIAASYEPLPGWTVNVVREQLDRPIETDHGPIEEQVSRIVWTGDGSPDGSIPPGAFRDFPISVQIPDEPGSTLTFKALQTYRGGEVVRWIGAPDAELPAATVAVTEPEGQGEGAGAGHGAADAAEPADAGEPLVSQAQVSAPAEDDGGDGLAIAALVVAALGLLAGGGALAIALRRRPSRPA